MTNDLPRSVPAAAATAFAAEFATSGREDWRAAAEAALKGRPLEPLIRRQTIDGVAIDAILERAAPRVVAGRPAGARWTAMTRVDLAAPEDANAQALEDLNNGASGLSLAFAAPGGEGLVADTLDRLDRALDGVLLDLAPLHLDPPPFESRMTTALAAALVEWRRLDPSTVQILFGVDMIRDLGRSGALPKPWPEMCGRVAGMLAALRRRGFTSPFFGIDARMAHNAGASEAQELAAAIASATEHVRGVTAAGLDLETAADAVSFTFACDADQFVGIAKLRAARLLWAAWRREAGLPERPIHIHVETSRRMMTRFDPQTNLVRTTLAAFAAGVGGADSLVVLPYDNAIGASDADSRRLARNAQSIILEESNVYRVADPAAGAGAIEALTDGLAEAAWTLFRDNERDGGMLAALTSGAGQQMAIEIRNARAREVAARRMPIVGVSEFPQAGEAVAAPPKSAALDPSPRLVALSGPELSEDEAGFETVVAAFGAGSSFADVRAAWRPNPVVAASALNLERLSTPFERLREEIEAREPRPAVYLAAIGPVARHAARAGFIRNLLAAGGLAAIEGPAAADPEAIAAAFSASGARLAILCGADDGYAEDGLAVVAALKARGATVWLAGKPKDMREALTDAGVVRFVAAGEDALDALRAAVAAAEPSAGGAS